MSQVLNTTVVFAALIGIAAVVMAPNPVLLVSGEDDKYSRDAPVVIHKAKDAYRAHEAEGALEGFHYPGGHELDQSRFDAVVEWTVSTATAR